MNFKLKKTEKLDGEVIYEIFIDEVVVHIYSERRMLHARSEAEAEFKKILERRKDGYPKEELIAEETV